MKLALQIAVPVILWLGASFLLSEDESDLRYFLVLPFALVAFLGFIIGMIFFFSWLYV